MTKVEFFNEDVKFDKNLIKKTKLSNKNSLGMLIVNLIIKLDFKNEVFH